MTYRLTYHPLVLQSTLQSFLVRAAIIRRNREEIAEYHRLWLARGWFEDLGMTG